MVVLDLDKQTQAHLDRKTVSFSDISVCDVTNLDT